jgi:hypothetical protein
MNDASRDQDPLASYGSANLGRLATIAKKYDADQLYKTLQNGGFLLEKGRSWKNESKIGQSQIFSIC